MKDLAIYCAGGLGRELYCLIFNRIKNPEWNFVGFFDDGIEKGKPLQYGQCLGGLHELNLWSTPLDVVIANGSPKLLRQISDHINNSNVEFPNIVAPSLTYSDVQTVMIGKGNIFCSNCHISCNVKIGSFNVFNGDCVLGHESEIGDCNAFMPGVRISGGVKIMYENLFGANSFVFQGVKIGNNVHLTPGSILLTKPKDGGTYIGNPAKRLKY